MFQKQKLYLIDLVKLIFFPIFNLKRLIEIEN